MRLILATLAFFILFLWQTSFSQERKPVDNRVVAVSAMLSEDQFSSDYFLSELNIIESQRNRLSSSLKAHSKKLKRVSANIGAYEQKLEFEKVSESLAKEIEDTLLEHQLEDFYKLVLQRSILKTNRFEANLLWSHQVIQSKLGDEKEKFNEKAKAIVGEFMQEVEKERLRIVRSIIDSLPHEHVAKMKAIDRLQMHNIGLASQSINISPNVFNDWDEDDLNRYETKVAYTYLQAAAYNKELQQELEITGDQVEQLRAFQKSPVRVTPAGDRDKFRKVEKALRASGNEDELRKLLEQKAVERSAVEKENSEEILNQILLPFQRDVIREIAQFKRLKIESRSPDGVSALLAWAIEVVGVQETTILKKLKGLRSEIEELQTKRATSFERCCEKILDAMPDEAGQEFQHVFGRCYDLHAEKIDLYQSTKNVSKESK